MEAFAVKRMLQRFRDTEREIDNQIERLQILQERLESVGSPGISDMPRNPSPVGDRQAELIARYMDEVDALKQLEDRQKDLRRSVEEIVARIEGAAGPDKRAIVRFRYLENQRWERISEALFGGCEDFDERRDSYMRQVFRLHDSAMIEMGRIISEGGYENRLHT